MIGFNVGGKMLCWQQRRERELVWLQKKKVFLLNYLSNQHSYTSKIKGEVFKEQFNSLMYWLLSIVSTVSMFRFEPRSGKYNNVPFILWGGFLYMGLFFICEFYRPIEFNRPGIVYWRPKTTQHNFKHVIFHEKKHPWFEITHQTAIK